MEENFTTKERLAKTHGFTATDFDQIESKGIALENVENQLSIFKNGITKTVLAAPATTSNGVLKLSEEEFHLKATFFEANKSDLRLKKFVPASGAASRMFKFLNEFLNDFDVETESINAYINRKRDYELAVFIVGMDKLPFFESVHKSLKETYSNFDALERDYKNYYFIKWILSSEGLDFANRPKGVLPFHHYGNHIATATEEHLKECAFYASSNGVSNLHFTVSEEHKNLFEEIIASQKETVEKATNTSINTSFSFQNKSTDTIAVDLENNPFRDEEGSLMFRPGGHGALIENLNNLESDIIFIKNIDNVIQNHIESIALYKNALAGVLLELQQKVFQYLNKIDTANETVLTEIIAFVQKKLNATITEDFNKYTTENKVNYIKELLDRPIRVCGMVKNEGEPGGGPFWVCDAKGNLSLQIVESSQVDLQNQKQLGILQSATHFNPVDLVCGIRNYKNECFDLARFVDHNSGFIVEKNSNGRALKGYELPGLWNGAMAKWITIFVEVPLITFNPVKTVNDLLKASHQA